MTALPQKLGKYHVLAHVAQGGMAEIYKAKTIGLAGFEKIVALKRILPSFAGEERFIRSFIDEANIAVTLNHRNIVQVLDFGKADDELYLVMEFIDGVDLKSALYQSTKAAVPLPTAIACAIVGDVAAGLDYAHRKVDADGRSLGIVHCDVSPQNVMLSFDGFVKILDFGVARARFSNPPKEKRLRGKPRYMAPEQTRGLQPTAATDVFALGILCWELLTGLPLFEGSDLGEILAAVRRAEAPPVSSLNPDIPSALSARIARALSPNAEDRGDAGTLAVALSLTARELSPTSGARALADWLTALYGEQGPGDDTRQVSLEDAQLHVPLPAHRRGAIDLAGDIGNHDDVTEQITANVSLLTDSSILDDDSLDAVVPRGANHDDATHDGALGELAQPPMPAASEGPDDDNEKTGDHAIDDLARAQLAVDRAAARGDGRTRAQALVALGWACRRRCQFERGRKALNSALSQQGADREDTDTAQMLLGALSDEVGEFTNARDHYATVLRSARVTGRPIGVHCEVLAGQNRANLGQLERGAEQVRGALARAHLLDAAEIVVEGELALARILLTRTGGADLDEALAAAARAQAGAHEARLVDREALAAARMATAHLRRRELVPARERSAAAVAMLELLPSPSPVAEEILYTHYSVLTATGDDGAIDYLERGRQSIRNKLATITDPTWRRTFVDRVALHSLLLADPQTRPA